MGFVQGLGFRVLGFVQGLGFLVELLCIEWLLGLELASLSLAAALRV